MTMVTAVAVVRTFTNAYANNIHTATNGHCFFAPVHSFIHSTTYMRWACVCVWLRFCFFGQSFQPRHKRVLECWAFCMLLDNIYSLRSLLLRKMKHFAMACNDFDMPSIQLNDESIDFSIFPSRKKTDGDWCTESRIAIIWISYGDRRRRRRRRRTMGIVLSVVGGNNKRKNNNNKDYEYEKNRREWERKRT